MKIIFNIILIVLVFLAISSGITTIILMQQDIDFFGKYGFTNYILMAYGANQLIGGVLLAIPIFRVAGAIVVAITFVISAIVLFMDNNFPVTIVTVVCVLLLGFVIKESIKKT